MNKLQLKINKLNEMLIISDISLANINGPAEKFIRKTIKQHNGLINFLIEETANELENSKKSMFSKIINSFLNRK